MKDIQIIIEAVMHDGIHTYKPKNSSALLPSVIKDQKQNRKHKKGAVAVVRSKEDLSTPNGVKGYVITSRESLGKDAPGLSHWTPNPYNYLTYVDDKRQYIKDHTEQNLQQINTFVVDVDSKKQPYTEILTAALNHSVGVPTLILETPKGFQVYFVLDNPLFISNNNDYRGLKVAKRISSNIRRSLANVLQGVDVACNDFGFFRMPSNENVCWFNRDMHVTMHDLIAWSKRQDDDQGRGLFVVPNKETKISATRSEWFQALLTSSHVKGSAGQIGRDNLMYTLALACYSDGMGEGETLDLLDEYNTSLAAPLRHSEVQKIVRSAYKGKFQGASQDYVRELLDAWCPGQEVEITPHARGWYKHKKEREDRMRSHLDEWEADLLAYIADKTSPAEPVTWTTQRQLCEAVGIPRSTFNELIRKSKKIMVKRRGKGRSAQTGLTSVAVLLRCALEFNQTHRAKYYAAVALMTTSSDNERALWELEVQLSLLTPPPVIAQITGKKFNSS